MKTELLLKLRPPIEVREVAKEDLEDDFLPAVFWDRDERIFWMALPIKDENETQVYYLEANEQILHRLIQKCESALEDAAKDKAVSLGLLEAADGMLALNEEYAAIAKEAVAEGIPMLTVRK